MSSKVGAIGDKDSVFGFKSIGLDVVFANTPEEIQKTIRKMADDNYAVIFITEKAASLAESEIDKYRFKPSPAIIPIPGITGNTGEGMKNVSLSVEKAVGSDILKDK